MRKLLLALLILPGLVGAATLEEDVQNLVKAFKGDKKQHLITAKTLAYMGVSDARVFDLIVELLKSDADAARGDGREQEWRIEHYLRALGWSGNAKYLPTLQSFTDDRNYRRSTLNALNEFPQYQKWNPIISNRTTFDAKHSDDVNRILNMLGAEDSQLRRLGALRVHHGKHYDDVLLERLAQEAGANYMKTLDSETSDTIGWMLRALGGSRNPKYVPLLEQAWSGASSAKIKHGATAGLRYHGR